MDSKRRRRWHPSWLAIGLALVLVAVVFATEYTDDFSTDTSSSYTAEDGGLTYDATDDEMDADYTGSNAAIRFNTSHADLEHEAQATFLINTSSYVGGGMVRMVSGEETGYAMSFDTASRYLDRYRAGGYVNLSDTTDSSWATSDWATVRIAAEGTAGNTVNIDLWFTNHGTTKPGDPGWLGDDGSPDQEYADASADRLDEAGGTYGGFGSMCCADVDSRHDFFKTRLVTDRSAGGGIGALLPLLGVGR